MIECEISEDFSQENMQGFLRVPQTKFISEPKLDFRYKTSPTVSYWDENQERGY